MKWEEPPPRHSRHWSDDLKSRPGEWARVADYLPNQRVAAGMAVSNIRRGKQKCYEPAGSFEAVHRKTDDGWSVYARYVGGEK